MAGFAAGVAGLAPFGLLLVKSALGTGNTPSTVIDEGRRTRQALVQLLVEIEAIRARLCLKRAYQNENSYQKDIRYFSHFFIIINVIM